MEIETFLNEMARRNEISNWGVAQARDALELYYEQFRGIALAARPDDTVSMPSSQTSSRPSPKPDEPITASDRPRQETSKPYQKQAVVVNGPVRQTNKPHFDISRSAAARDCRPPNREIIEHSPPAISGGTQSLPSVRAKNADSEDCSRQAALVPKRQSKDAPAQGPGAGKTNWRLLEARVREYLRVGHYSYRTEQTYLGWIRQFVAFHEGRKPSTMDAGHVRDFLRHLAMDRQVASSMQNQALNAVVFLFKSVIKKEIGDFSDFQRARRGFRLPVVASREEIKAVIDRMSGRERFMAALLYGTGMRINELLRLRVQDVQFDQKCLMVRGGKGDKDRYVPFPTKYRDEMKQWLQKRQEQYQGDKARNMHEVEVPGALALKYPNAPYE